MLIKMTDDVDDDDDDDDDGDDDDYHMMGKRDGIVKHMMQFPLHSNVMGNKMWLHCNNLLLSDCLFDYVQRTTGVYSIVLHSTNYQHLSGHVNCYTVHHLYLQCTCLILQCQYVQIRVPLVVSGQQLENARKTMDGWLRTAWSLATVATVRLI